MRGEGFIEVGAYVHFRNRLHWWEPAWRWVLTRLHLRWAPRPYRVVSVCEATSQVTLNRRLP